ncbi:LysR substrate-binding domain-containing protein [Neisseriaceae bacterium TC5R-5]|nr:LysR substrate-binding domain-containing protein [Neisseriaceae bacterium TC5R-5]
MHFDLTDLRLFVLVAEEGNLTRAATRQHLSLAAASARIKALEAQTGLPLLYRESRGMRLSPPGLTFLHHARGVLHQVAQLHGDLQEYSDGVRAHLRVFANTTAVSDFLPEILPSFLANNSHVNIDLQEKPNADIARGVLDRRADLGIVAGQVDTLGLQRLHFSTDRLVLVTANNHRFAQHKTITFADTLEEDAIGMQQDSTLQNFLGQITAKLGKPLKLRIQLDSFDAMCRMIGAGVGVGVVPESAARRNRDSMGLALIELTDSWSIRERYVLMRDRATLSAHAQALINALLAHYQAQAEQLSQNAKTHKK